MCGIFGYLGGSKNAAREIFRGLKRLDYRGYDSWGIGVLSGGKITIDKQVGEIAKARVNLPPARLGIGHTRWATHGAVNRANAHPHLAKDGSFAIVQNGIVENCQELKEALFKKGDRFVSETDTEVIVRLIEEQLKKTKDIKEAARTAFLALEGRNTIAVLTKDGQIVAARNGSPLLIGVKDQSGEEIYLSSDSLSFTSSAQKMLVLENGQLVVCRPGLVELFELKTGKKLAASYEPVKNNGGEIGKDGFAHFMIKEINEGPLAIERILGQDKKTYLNLAQAIKNSRRVYAVGSGTAGASAAQIAYYLRDYGKIAAISLIGAEAQEYFDLFGPKDLVIAPSQSGETADVLEVLEAAKSRGTKIASFVNMPGSMMSRMADFKFMAEAGPEICVLSTKIFVSQLAWGYLIAKAAQGKLKQGAENLRHLSLVMRQFLAEVENARKIKALAKSLAGKEHIFLLGKGQNLQIVKEGMIKIIEGAYLHAHAIAAGDLKHYAITLIEKGVVAIFVVSEDGVKKDIVSSLHEVKARGGEIIGVSSQAVEGFDQHLFVPDTGETSAIMNIIPLQLLAYYLALEKGNSVDRPRNIAKSVTVK